MKTLKLGSAMKMIKLIPDPLNSMLDISAPAHVQVEWDEQRRVLYVHVEGITQLRCCRVKRFEFKERK